MCVCLRVCMCTCGCKYLWSPEVFIRTPRAGVTNSCELFDIADGYELGSSTKAAITLSH